MYKQPIYYRDLLKNGYYDLTEVLDQGISRGELSDTGDITHGEIASLFLVCGHIDLAEAMVKQGVKPEMIRAKHMPRWSGREEASNTYPLAISFLKKQHSQFDRMHDGVGHMIASGWDTLRYMLSNLDQWPIGLNDTPNNHTLLAHVPPPSGGQISVAREQMLTMFLEAGADINVQSPTQNAIMKCAWANADLGIQALDDIPWSEYQRLSAHAARPAYEHMLSLGFDKTKNPHIAMAYAITQDSGYRDLNQKENSFGVRAQALVDLGFKITSPIDCPYTVNPFYRAVETGQTHVVRRLVEVGCDPAWINPETGDTLVALAASARPEILTSLLAIPNEDLARVANHANKKGNTPLHQAVASLSLPLVQKLVACGADINAPNKQGKLPLQMVKRNSPAAKKKLEDIIAFLDGCGMKIQSHETPGVLHQACKSLACDVVEQLIQQGADVHQLDIQGRTPLIVLAQNAKINYYEEAQQKEARRSYERIVDALLDAGAQINAVDKKGNTPLHHAVAAPSPIMVGVLLKLGADPNVLNKKGLTPSHMWHDKTFYHRQKNDTLQIIQLFSGTGFDPHFQGPNGELPFEKMRDSGPFKSAQDDWELRRITPQVAAPRVARSRL